jgi:glycosyltransferase involved in cell wall biosynthesis
VIPNGMDVRRIDEADARDVRAEWGLAADDFVVGTVARLDATKNTITLARAFAQLIQDEPAARWKLLVVGDGSERPRLEEFIAAQGLQSAAVFTGARQDVPRLLKAMNVFALPSLSEGMPITVLEAMAARLPVVATNVGALPTLVADGVTGWLVAPQQPEALAAKLSWLWQHHAQAIAFGAAGRQKVEREYGMDVMLRRYAELYHSVLRA